MSDLLTPERDRSGDDPSRPANPASEVTEPRDDTGAALRSAAHWPALDGLRGLAVAGVVAFHLGWISGGFLGVELFFALSGFLITTLLVREHRETGRVDLAAFWGRRFRRLLPAVMALVVVVLAWTWIWGSPAEQAGARTDARWSIPYLANWHLIAEARDYWASATDSSVFTHLWSLAIEEQFYLAWPLVAWWALRSRSGERRLLQLAVVGSVASIAAMVLLYDPASPSRVYLGTDTRAAGLLLGAVMALNPIRRGLREVAAAHPRRLDVVAGVIVVILAASWVVGGDHLGLLLQGGLPLHSLLSAVLVAVLATSSGLADRSGDGAGDGRAAAAFDRRWLVWLGQRSYGIYLWHWPVIVLAEPRWTALPAPVRDLAMIAVSLVLAEVSFRLLEHPVRRRSGWASGARASWATLAVSALAIAVAVVAPSGRGHVAAFDVGSVGAPASIDPPPSSASTGSIAATATTDPPVAPDTTTATTATPATPAITATSTTSASTATTDATDATTDPAGDGASAGAVAAGDAPVVLPEIGPVLWVGDSVANDLAPALGAAFGAAGVPWTNGAGDGVRFTPGGGVDPVELWTRVLGGATFSTVVLHLSYWDSPADVDMLRVSLSWFRDTVTARGARLVIVTPPPVRDDLVDPGLARQIQVAQELVDGSAGAVVLVDSAPLWGPTMAYDIDGDGAPDRKPDGVHVCPQGAARFANWFVAELATRFAGIAPQPAAAWAAGPWATDARYDTPAGACVALG